MSNLTAYVIRDTRSGSSLPDPANALNDFKNKEYVNPEDHFARPPSGEYVVFQQGGIDADKLHPTWMHECIITLNILDKSGASGSPSAADVPGSRSRTLTFASEADTVPASGKSTLRAVIDFLREYHAALVLRDSLRGLRQLVADKSHSSGGDRDVAVNALTGLSAVRDFHVGKIAIDTSFGPGVDPPLLSIGSAMVVASGTGEDLVVMIRPVADLVDVQDVIYSGVARNDATVVLLQPTGSGWKNPDELAKMWMAIDEINEPMLLPMMYRDGIVAPDGDEVTRLVFLALHRASTRRLGSRGSSIVTSEQDMLQTIDDACTTLAIKASSLKLQ